VDADERLGTRIILENDLVRVWEHRIPAGQMGHLHLHRRPYLSIVISGGKGDTVGADDKRLDRFEVHPGDALWYGPEHLPEIHAFRNDGEEDIILVTTELLGPDPALPVAEAVSYSARSSDRSMGRWGASVHRSAHLPKVGAATSKAVSRCHAMSWRRIMRLTQGALRDRRRASAARPGH